MIGITNRTLTKRGTQVISENWPVESGTDGLISKIPHTCEATGNFQIPAVYKLVERFEAINGGSVEDWTCFEDLPKEELRSDEQVLKALEGCIYGAIDCLLDQKNWRASKLAAFATLLVDVKREQV